MASFESKFSFTQDELELIVKRHYCQQKTEHGKFKITQTKIMSLNEPPIGYLGEHYILQVKLIPKVINFKKGSDLHEESINFFVKYMNNENDYLKSINVFQKETLLYQSLLPRLQDFPIGVKKWAPSCYLIQKNKLIVFENLTDVGFGLCPSPQNNRALDIEHLKIALVTLAKFHVSSILFEERTQIKIPQHYPGYLNENEHPTDPCSTRYINLQNCVEVLTELAKQIPKYQSDTDRIEPELKKLFKKIHSFCEPSKIYQNVVNHGDLWKNNILFKYEVRDKLHENKTGRFIVECDLELNENGLVRKSIPGFTVHHVPVEAVLCDFQLSRYVPPAVDVMTLLALTCRNLDFHLEQLLNFYYQKLYTSLQDHMDPDEINVIISKDQFFKSCNEYKLFAYFESCLFNLTILLPPELSVELIEAQKNYDDFITEKRRLKLCLQAFETDNQFSERLTEDLCRIIDNYILS